MAHERFYFTTRFYKDGTIEFFITEWLPNIKIFRLQCHPRIQRYVNNNSIENEMIRLKRLKNVYLIVVFAVCC